MSRDGPAMLCPLIRGPGSNSLPQVWGLHRGLVSAGYACVLALETGLKCSPTSGRLGRRGSQTSHWGGGATAGVT